MIDPLFESWRRRAQPTPIDQFANFYLSHPASPVDAGPLAVTREWIGLRDAALMRRGLDVARSQVALPLHRDTLAALEAETWGAFLMSVLLIELQSRLDNGGIDGQQRALLRLVAPLTQLMTRKQAVNLLIELVDGIASSGAVDRSRLQELLQDVQRRPDGESTTDALAIAALSCPDLHDALAALMGRASSCLRSIREPRLAAAGRQAVGALERAALWLESGKEPDVLEAGARRLAMTLARGLQLALLCEHAQWMLDHGGDRRGFAAALRYSRLPVDLIHEVDPELDRLLLGRG
jgi:acyl-CoA dehydrogenase